MSQKNNFSLSVFTTAHDERIFNGAAARNVLLALYGPEFCVVDDSTGGDTVRLLIARGAIQVTNGVWAVSYSPPETYEIFPPARLGNEGLYIHPSVLDRLEWQLDVWKQTGNLFLSDCGLDCPFPLQEAVHEFVFFLGAHCKPEDTHAGYLVWK